MVDPITTAGTLAAGRALAKASGGDDQEKARLIGRILGPSADALGDALRRWTEYRLRNVGRIVDVAEKRLPPGAARGFVPPRVAHKILEDGSYCDDELMVEYLGGLLASARTIGGRDDRAATWTALITQMSVFEIRAHYLLYTELIAGLLDNDETGSMPLYVDADELTERLGDLEGPDRNKDADYEYLAHAHAGLQRHTLAEVTGVVSTYGPREGIGEIFPVPQAVPYQNIYRLGHTDAGLELWTHAHGLQRIDSDDQAVRDATAHPLIPRLTTSYVGDTPTRRS